MADVCARKGRGAANSATRKSQTRHTRALATRGHYGKAETVIHCSKKDEIARGSDEIVSGPI